MTINLKDNFDLDKVKFTDMELEIPYEESHQTKEMSEQKTYHNRNN